MGRTRRFLVPALAAAALLFVALGVARDARLLDSVAWSIRPLRLLAATASEVALLGWSVYVWSRILACFDGPQPGFRVLLRVWIRSTLAKYLPGSIWSIAATAEMATRVGSSPVALPSSFVIQGVLSLAGALIVAAIGGPLVAAGTAGSLRAPVWLVAAVSAAVLALAHPSALDALVRAAARLARRDAPQWRGTWSGGVVLLALHAGTWAAYGLSFALFATSVVALHAPSWAGLAAVNALAFVAGFVAFFAPGGVGVREAALVGLLAPVLPGVRARVVLAATSRLWLVLTELIGASLVVAAGVSGSRSVRRE